MRFAAFLRGVNVGTHNRVKMDALRKAVEAAGARNVSTYLQSGNVFLESETEAEALRMVGVALQQLALRADAVLRTAEELERVLAASPFGEDGADDSHRFVTFLAEPTARSMPRCSPKGDWEVLLQTPGEVYSVARLVEGKYGAPNSPVESKLGVVATTRNWAVVCEVASRFRE